MKISIPPLDLLVIAPEIVVLVTALLVMIVDLFLGKEHKSRLAWLSLIGVLAAAVLSYYFWDGSDRELQNMLVADGYALFLNLVILTAAALAILFSVDYAAQSATRLAQGEYYSLLLLSTTGMMLMAAAINLMTMFLALEILSIALYVLVGLHRTERRSGEAAIKYFLLGAFASGFLLYGMALIYGQVSTTSLPAVHDYVVSLDGMFPLLLPVALGLMIVGFGFKVALVPFQMWTPDVYEGAPTSVTAFMSVGAKAAGFAALGRVVLYAFGDLQGDWGRVLAILAALTMTVGNLAALRQTNLKRMLAYSSIAQAGYILVGMAAGNALGVSAVLFYLLIYAFMNTGAFAVIIAVSRFPEAAEGRETLDGLAGLAGRKPWLAAAMALFMLSLAGVPPLAGFLGKLYLFSAAVEDGLTWLAILGVLNSVVAATYYLRVVAVMYMDPSEGRAGESRACHGTPSPLCPALQVGVGVAAMAVVVLGIWPAPIQNLVRVTLAALLGG
jgi:NADH-quinone oxidoreductase subunit N